MTGHRVEPDHLKQIPNGVMADSCAAAHFMHSIIKLIFEQQDLWNSCFSAVSVDTTIISESVNDQRGGSFAAFHFYCLNYICR